MSDAGDDIPIETPAAVEAAAEVPKGKLSVEDALQVGFFLFFCFKDTNHIYR
jgi:hypothetical protein